MADAVSATSTFRLASGCCGAASGDVFGGMVVTVEDGAALAGGCAGAPFGASAKANGFAAELGACATDEDGALTVPRS